MHSCQWTSVSVPSHGCLASFPQKSWKLPRPHELTQHPAPARSGTSVCAWSEFVLEVVRLDDVFNLLWEVMTNHVIGVEAEQICLKSELSAGLINSLSLMQRSTFVVPINLMALESVRTSDSKWHLPSFSSLDFFFLVHLGTIVAKSTLSDGASDSSSLRSLVMSASSMLSLEFLVPA